MGLNLDGCAVWRNLPWKHSGLYSQVRTLMDDIEASKNKKDRGNMKKERNEVYFKVYTLHTPQFSLGYYFFGSVYGVL